MVKYFPLDLIIKQGETYYTPRNAFFIIKKIGTGSSGDASLYVDDKKTCIIKNLTAPLHKTESNLLGPIDLKEYYIVIPPETKFYVSGDAGSATRLVGVIGLLKPGEAPPADVQARFNTQPNQYITYVEGTKALGVDEALPANAEVEVISLTPKTIEKYIFNGPVMATVENYSPTEGDLSLMFYIDNIPLQKLTDLPGTIRGGIDILSCPRPPTDTTEQEPFSFIANPIVLEGDHTLSVRVRNTSGASIKPAAGTALTFTVTMIAVFIRT
jgi:hypothetical protein